MAKPGTHRIPLNALLFAVLLVFGAGCGRATLDDQQIANLNRQYDSLAAVNDTLNKYIEADEREIHAGMAKYQWRAFQLDSTTKELELAKLVIDVRIQRLNLIERLDSFEQRMKNFGGYDPVNRRWQKPDERELVRDYWYKQRYYDSGNPIPIEALALRLDYEYFLKAFKDRVDRTCLRHGDFQLKNKFAERYGMNWEYRILEGDGTIAAAVQVLFLRNDVLSQSRTLIDIAKQYIRKRG